MYYTNLVSLFSLFYSFSFFAHQLENLYEPHTQLPDFQQEKRIDKIWSHSHPGNGKYAINNKSSALVDVNINGDFDFTNVPTNTIGGYNFTGVKYNCPDDYTVLLRTSTASSTGIYVHIFVGKWNGLPQGSTPSTFVLQNTVHLYNSSFYFD